MTTFALIVPTIAESNATGFVGGMEKNYHGTVYRGELYAADRRAYAEAVEKAVLAKQRSSLLGAGTPVSRCPCASGTWHSDGADISAAVRAQQRAALQASAARDRANRTPAQWASLYAEAMVEKRGQGVEQQRAA